MPRHQPPLPTVTTSGLAVTQHQFSHVLSRQRTSAEKPGQIGKTVTVKAVCRSDIQGQKGGAGKKFTHVLSFFFFFLFPSMYFRFSKSILDRRDGRVIKEEVGDFSVDYSGEARKLVKRIPTRLS